MQRRKHPTPKIELAHYRPCIDSSFEMVIIPGRRATIIAKDSQLEHMVMSVYGPVYVGASFNMGIYKDIAQHQPYHSFDGPGELSPVDLSLTAEYATPSKINDARNGLCDL